MVASIYGCAGVSCYTVDLVDCVAVVISVNSVAVMWFFILVWFIRGYLFVPCWFACLVILLLLLCLICVCVWLWFLLVVWF